MTPTLRFRVIYGRNSNVSSLMLDRINRINTIFIVLLSFPEGRTKTQCRQRRQDKALGSNRRWVVCHPIENTEPGFIFLPRSGILLSQFLQETEKKKRESNRSGKSCRIRKRAVMLEFLRSSLKR